MVRQSVARAIKGLSDKHLTIKMQIAENDRVFTYCVATAKHTDSWLGYPATNKKLTYENLFISRFQDGKIIEHWVILDAFGMLRQMGAI
jgi:predicted ester cyclase